MNKLIRIIHTLRMNIFSKGKIKIYGYPNYGKGVDIIAKNDGEVTIRNKCSISSYSHISSVGGKLLFGENVYINRHCIIVCRDKISIGNRCIFGPNVCIYDHDHVFSYDGIKESYKTDAVTIDDGCWIGANTIILRGTHIGEKCVIGAGCIIKGNIPAHSLVTSNRSINVQHIERQNNDIERDEYGKGSSD